MNPALYPVRLGSVEISKLGVFQNRMGDIQYKSEFYYEFYCAGKFLVTTGFLEQQKVSTIKKGMV